MLSMIIAMLSGALIALGAAAIVRDLWRPAGSRVQRKAKATVPPDMTTPLLPARDTSPPVSPVAPVRLPAKAIAPVHPPPGAANGVAAPSTAVTLAGLTHAIDDISTEAEDPGPEGERHPWMESRWHALDTVIAGAVHRVNEALAPVALTIDAAGKPSWSYKNRGFGTHRRIRIENTSTAWLRIELNAARQVLFKLRAHRAEQALVNATTEAVADGLGETTATDAVARCMSAIAQYAAWSVPRAEADRDASAALWTEFAPLAHAALDTANVALAQADIALVPLSTATFDSEVRRFRWPLSVTFGTETIALMYVERDPDAIEISVGGVDRTRIPPGQRRRVDVNGLTPHGLAEQMALAVWPSVTNIRQVPA